VTKLLQTGIHKERFVAMIKKILIVDDSPISRKMLKSCVPKDNEYEFIEAGDGLAGLKTFKDFGPDVTFLDLTMPVMDGTQALEEMKKVNGNSVIIVLTADIQVKSIERVMQLGAFHVLKKPPTKDGVRDILQKAFEYKRQANES
jgi:two-component system chemotaxis response regulator CheY